MAVPLWPFGRRRAEPVSPDVVERPREQWRELAPLDRVVTSVLEQPVVASAPRFAQELPSRWTAPAAIQPLDHDVRPDLVGGLVRGLTSTVAATAATTRESDVADLRWWRGRAARRRPAPENTAELGRPAVSGPPPGVDEPTDEPASMPSATDAVPVRPVAALALPRTPSVVASRRPPSATVTPSEPVYPPATLPMGLPAISELAAPATPPEPPVADGAVAGPDPLAGQPVQVVRVAPGVESAPTPETRPEPPGPVGPASIAVGRPERRRRTWLGAPLPPTADPTVPPIIPPPSAMRRTAPADPARDPSTVDGRADEVTAPDQPSTPDERAPDEPTPLVDGPAATSSGAKSREWRDISPHSTSNAPLDAPDIPAIAAAPDPEPTPVVAPGRPEPAAGPPRDERLREEPAGRDAGRSVSEGSARGARPSAGERHRREPDPAGRSARSMGGIQTITSRVAPTTAPTIAGAEAAASAVDRAAAVRVLGQNTASLYDRAAPFIPTAASAEDALATLPRPAAAGGVLGAATDLPGRAASPGTSAVRQPLSRPALPHPAPTGPAIPRRPALPPPVELVAPGFVGAAAAAAAAAGPLTAATRTAGAVEQPPSEETSRRSDPAELDRLAGQLYGRIQDQLRADLLIGRERAQMLTDLG